MKQWLAKAEGDYLCCISDFAEMRAHIPGWNFAKSLDPVFEEIHPT